MVREASVFRAVLVLISTRNAKCWLTGYLFRTNLGDITRRNQILSNIGLNIRLHKSRIVYCMVCLAQYQNVEPYINIKFKRSIYKLPPLSSGNSWHLTRF